jgi:hypothetical protein
MEGPTEPIFVPFMCRPRSVKIFAGHFMAGDSDVLSSDVLSIWMRSLCVSLTSPATLERLELEISFIYPDDYDAFLENLRDADIWSQLDSIIAHPTGSRLQRVDIYIQGTVYEEDHDLHERYREFDGNELDEVVRAVNDSLPLLSEKGILFVDFAKPKFLAEYLSDDDQHIDLWPLE